MDLSKLEIGMEFKNYKAICEFLNEKIKSGQSKVAQLSMWSSYFKYEKNGYKFNIEEIYKEPKGKMSRYGFITDIEELILDLIVQDENMGKVFLSKNQLFKVLNMTNMNYGFSRYHIPKLSIFTKIDEKEIHEFYDFSKSALVRSVETALKRLKSKSLIFWSSAITVCKVKAEYQMNEAGIKATKKKSGKDEYGKDIYEYDILTRLDQKHTEATQDEVKAILAAERLTMNELNCQNKQDVIKKGLWNEYSDKVKDIIFSSHNIIYYYDSYKIISNEDHIYTIWEDLKDLSLTDSNRDLKFKNLNSGVKQKLLVNAIKRHEKELEKDSHSQIFAEFNSEELDGKHSYRSNFKYVENNEILIDHLIDIRSLDIKKDLRKIKI